MQATAYSNPHTNIIIANLSRFICYPFKTKPLIDFDNILQWHTRTYGTHLVARNMKVIVFKQLKNIVHSWSYVKKKNSLIGMTIIPQVFCT